MKTMIVFLIALTVCSTALTQGTLVFDQQSAAGGIGTHGNPIQSLQPMGQSFTPTLSAVGFVQLQLTDGIGANGLGAAVFVNLVENSITGNVVASSSPVVLANGFFGTTSFFFPLNIPITSGSTYFFLPILQSGDASFLTLSDQYGYSGGSAFFVGQPDPAGKDFWFREGIVVPEPGVASILVIGSAWVALVRRSFRMK